MPEKFLLDYMLGKLARWLRLLGYDSLYLKLNDDSSLISIALRESRILLTRDRELIKRKIIKQGKVKALLILSNEVEEQIKEVNNAFPLKFQKHAFCPFCNVRLTNTLPEKVFSQVPPYVYLTQDHFFACSSCHRVFWPGTQLLNFYNTINKSLGLRLKS